MKHAQVLGNAQNGLYHVGTSLKSNQYPPSTSLLSTECLTSTSLYSRHNLTQLWHCRLGHFPFPQMRHLQIQSCNFPSVDCICHISPQARQQYNSFPISNSRACKLFELLHVDLWGPYATPTYNGYKYFLTIVDDFSRAT